MRYVLALVAALLLLVLPGPAGDALADQNGHPCANVERNGQGPKRCQGPPSYTLTPGPYVWPQTTGPLTSDIGLVRCDPGDVITGAVVEGLPEGTTWSVFTDDAGNPAVRIAVPVAVPAQLLFTVGTVCADVAEPAHTRLPELYTLHQSRTRPLSQVVTMTAQCDRGDDVVSIANVTSSYPGPYGASSTGGVLTVTYVGAIPDGLSTTITYDVTCSDTARPAHTA